MPKGLVPRAGLGGNLEHLQGLCVRALGEGGVCRSWELWFEKLVIWLQGFLPGSLLSFGGEAVAFFLVDYIKLLTPASCPMQVTSLLCTHSFVLQEAQRLSQVLQGPLLLADNFFSFP